jgi:hypothetical protein
LARAKTPAARRELAAEYGATLRLSEERVDPAEVASIVAEAAIARNGWKVILGRCAPTTKPRTALQLAREALAARDPAARGPAARDRTERGRSSDAGAEMANARREHRDRTV